MREIVAVSLLLLALSAAGAPAWSQEAQVLATVSEGVVVDAAALPTLTTGTRVGFVDVQAGRKEVAQGAVLDLRDGRALVQITAGTTPKQGDVAVLCPDPVVDPYRDLRPMLQQFKAEAKGRAAQAAGQLEPTVDQLQTALDTRDALVKGGGCDTVEYDRQISALSGDLRSLSTTVQTGVQQAPPSAASGAPSSSALPPPTGAPDATDPLGKIVALLQSIGLKFGQPGAGAGGSGPVAGFPRSPTPSGDPYTPTPPAAGQEPPPASAWPPPAAGQGPPPAAGQGPPPAAGQGPPPASAGPPSPGGTPSVPPVATSPLPVSPLATIHGRILGTAVGVGGAEVTAVEWKRTAKSAPDGSYFVQGPGGRVTILVKAPGFEHGSLVTMVAPGVAVARNVLLKRSVAPGPGAASDDKIQLPAPPPKPTPIGPIGTTPWWNTPKVTQPALTTPNWASVPVPPRAHSGEARIRGHVTDDRGQPVRGAHVSVSPGVSGTTNRRDVSTGDGGVFTVDGLQPSEYRVVATAPGLLQATRQIRLDPGKVESLTLSLLRPARIRGRVTDQRGQPIAGAHVSLDQRVIATTQNDGTFATSDLHPGEYQVGAAATGFHGAAQKIRVDSGDVESLTFSLPRALGAPRPLPGKPPTPLPGTAPSPR